MSKFKEGPLVLMLRDGEVEQFNASTRKTETLDLSNANLRGADLRHVDLHKADLRDAYPRRRELSSGASVRSLLSCERACRRDQDVIGARHSHPLSSRLIKERN